MCLCVCLSLCVFAGNKPELNCPSTVPVVSDWTCCEAEKVSHAQSPEHECNREYDPREMDGAPFRQLHKLFFELRFLSDRHTDTQTHRHTDTQTHRHTDTPTHRHRHRHKSPLRCACRPCRVHLWILRRLPRSLIEWAHVHTMHRAPPSSLQR